MMDSVNFVVILCFINCCIKFLNGGYDDFGIVLKLFYEFICIVGIIYCIWFKSFVF